VQGITNTALITLFFLNAGTFCEYCMGHFVGILIMNKFAVLQAVVKSVVEL